VDASISEIRSQGSGYASASMAKTGMIAVYPQSRGRSSRMSTASTSPGRAPLDENRTGHRIDPGEVKRGN
jgi:hypothetical protein